VTNLHEIRDDSLQVREVLSLLIVTRLFHVWRDVFTCDTNNLRETHDDSRQVRGVLALLHAP